MSTKTYDEAMPEWRQEISEYLQTLTNFSKNDDIIENLRKISSMSARVRYIQSAASRTTRRDVAYFKETEIDTFLKEADFQFRVWSRIAQLHKDEWEMTRR